MPVYSRWLAAVTTGQSARAVVHGCCQGDVSLNCQFLLNIQTPGPPCDTECSQLPSETTNACYNVLGVGFYSC